MAKMKEQPGSELMMDPRKVNVRKVTSATVKKSNPNKRVTVSKPTKRFGISNLKRG